MKKSIRILTLCALAASLLSLCGLFSVPVCAESDYTAYMEAPKYADRVQAYYLFNIDSRTVIAKKNHDVKINPGSLVKIMSGLIFCEQLSDRLDDDVTVTKEMQTQFSGKNVGLTEGEIISVRSLMYAAICQTANDAAIVLAFAVSDGVAPFVALMNARAKELGMTETVFCDVTGLGSGKDTTAKDLAILCEAAYDHPLFREISTKYAYEIPETNKSKSRSLKNSNWLINDTSGRYYSNTECCGLNAGATDEAGYCLATVAEYDKTHYICVVLGGESDDKNYYSYLVTNQLLALSEKSFAVRNITESLRLTGSLPVSGTGHRNASVAVKPAGDVTAFIPAGSLGSDKITFTEQFETDTPSAPITEGDIAGTLIIRFDGDEIGRTKLIYAESVERNKIIVFIDKIKEIMKSRVFIAAAVSAVILTVLYLLFLYPGKRSSKPVRQKSSNKIHKLR